MARMLSGRSKMPAAIAGVRLWRLELRDAWVRT
jgi:hypothetical protein